MNKNILITGASQGIGFETVKQLSLNPHHNIIATSRNFDKLQILKKSCLKENPKSNVIPFAFDLVNGNYNDELLPFIQSNISNIDIIINNAGKLVKKPFEKLTENDFDDVFNVNVKGVFKLIKYTISMMHEGSHIINISSMGGIQGSVKFPELSLYSASKGAVTILTETLAEEFKDKKVSVNALALGSVQTEMFSQAFPDVKAALTPKEMAEYICDFALNGHKYFNGKVLPVSSSTP